MGTSFTYANMATQQVVESWADERGLVASDQIMLHLEERFGVYQVHVTSAQDQGDFLVLRLTTDQWAESKEFALMPDGALSW